MWLRAALANRKDTFAREIALLIQERQDIYTAADHVNAEKRGGKSDPVTLEETLVLSPTRAPDVLEVNEALDELAKVDERKANVIELRYFGGMDREEIATALRLTVPTVKRDLRLGEAWLRRFLRGENAS